MTAELKIEHFGISALPPTSEKVLRKQAQFIRRTGFRFGNPSLERELARFFLLSLIKGGYGVPMFSDQVDKLWHELIVDTHFYSDFCEKAFGYYLHHIPRDSRIRPKKKQMGRDMKPAEFEKLYEERFGEKPDCSIWNHLEPLCNTAGDCKSCCPCCSA